MRELNSVVSKRRDQMRIYVRAIVALGLIATLAGCEKKSEEGESEAKQDVQESTDDKKAEEEKAQAVEPDAEKPATVGLVELESDKEVGAVVDEMTSRLEDSDAVELITTANHAEYVGGDEELPATQLLVFTNPKLETPFIEDSLRTGMELPQKVLVWNDDGTTRIAFNAPAYMAKRHGVERLDLFLGRMESGLSEVIKNASGASVGEMPAREDIGIEKDQGVVTRESNNGAGETADALVSYIEDTDELNLVADIDHQKRAKKAGSETLPARLVLFTHSELDGALLRGARSSGLDVPYAMFVSENKRGAILVAFNDPEYIAMRHGVELGDEKLEKIDSMLKKVAAKATKEQ
jgi:uncharacterized protein (DUF302 family)